MFALENELKFSSWCFYSGRSIKSAFASILDLIAGKNFYFVFFTGDTATDFELNLALKLCFTLPRGSRVANFSNFLYFNLFYKFGFEL